jgi:hypothetical protein
LRGPATACYEVAWNDPKSSESLFGLNRVATEVSSNVGVNNLTFAVSPELGRLNEPVMSPVVPLFALPITVHVALPFVDSWSEYGMPLTAGVGGGAYTRFALTWSVVPCTTLIV